MLYITWNGTKGIEIGNFTLHFYSLMFVFAFLFGFKIMEFIFKKEKEDIQKLDKIFTYTFLGTLLGARLGHVIFYQSELFFQDPLSILLPFRFQPEFKFTGFQGLASHGALLGVCISTYLASRYILKKNPLWLMDRMVFPFALGGFFVRIGNFFNSEIIGKPFNSDFAVLFLQQSDEYGMIVPRHASQVYEAICYLIFFIILMILYIKTDKQNYLGWFFGLFMTVLWFIRFCIEFTKEPQGDEYTTFLNFNSGQTLSIPMIIIGIIILITSKNRKINV